MRRWRKRRKAHPKDIIKVSLVGTWDPFPLRSFQTYRMALKIS
jgi:hypothetical protein